MVLKTEDPLFALRGEPILSYDFFDIADGVGYVTFYGGLASSGETFTTPSTTICSEVIKSGAAGSTSSTKFFDKTFDIVFSTPKNIKGNIYLTIPLGAYNASDTFYDLQELYVVGTVNHYDGTTTTQLGTDTSIDYGSPAIPLSTTTRRSVGFVANLKINQATTKHFKAGEILRIQIQAYNTVENTNIKVAVGHDPTNRKDYDEQIFTTFYSRVIEVDNTETTISNSTQMSFHVPFKLDI